MKKRTEKNLVQGNRWTAYAAAGAAAAMGANGTAEADIHYSGIVNIDVRDTNEFDGLAQLTGLFTLQAGTNLIFSPAHGGFSGLGSGVALIFGNNGTSNSVAAGPGAAAGVSFFGFGYVSRLPYGIPVQSLGFLTQVRQTMAWRSGYTNSQWLTAGTAYVGFMFDIGNGTQYGWLRATVDGAPYNGWTIIDYAYGDPGDSIFTGQTAIPEPGSLGLLAMGGLGLLMWRNRRKQAAAG